MSTHVVSKIWIHPIKGCRAVSVDSATLDRFGLVGDRRALVCRPDGSMITQRSHPQLATVAAGWRDSQLVVNAANSQELVVGPASACTAKRYVTVWSSAGLEACDAGEESTRWWTSFLGEPAHLVLMGSEFTRPLKAGRGQPGDEVSFADGAPVLAAHQPSLDQLNAWLNERGENPVPMDRFRPNLVVEGGQPFDEDSWREMSVGNLRFGSPWPCARCIVTTTDQATGQRGAEPLRTLAKFRRDPAKPADVNFGINWVPKTKNGVLRVGDPVVGH